MTDHHTTTLDHYQGLVDQLANEDAALEKYRTEFAEKLMQEYTEDNHKLSWQVAEWLGGSVAVLFITITIMDRRGRKPSRVHMIDQSKRWGK